MNLSSPPFSTPCIALKRSPRWLARANDPEVFHPPRTRPRPVIHSQYSAHAHRAQQTFGHESSLLIEETPGYDWIGGSRERRGKSLAGMARPERFELPTYSSGGCRSIQLSYGRAVGLIQCTSPAAGASMAQRFLEPCQSVYRGLSFAPAGLAHFIPRDHPRLAPPADSLGRFAAEYA